MTVCSCVFSPISSTVSCFCWNFQFVLIKWSNKIYIQLSCRWRNGCHSPTPSTFLFESPIQNVLDVHKKRVVIFLLQFVVAHEIWSLDLSRCVVSFSLLNPANALFVKKFDTLNSLILSLGYLIVMQIVNVDPLSCEWITAQSFRQFWCYCMIRDKFVARFLIEEIFKAVARQKSQMTCKLL